MAPPMKPRTRLLPSPTLSMRDAQLAQVSVTLALNAATINETLHPSTTMVPIITTTPSTPTRPTSTLDSQQPHPLHSTKTHAHYNVTLPTTSAYQNPWWPRIGTVVNEADIPKAWRPKQIQREEIHFWLFMGLAYVFLALGILGVWMISWSRCWWRGDCFWQPTEKRRKAKGRAEYARMYGRLSS